MDSGGLAIYVLYSYNTDYRDFFFIQNFFLIEERPGIWPQNRVSPDPIGRIGTFVIRGPSQSKKLVQLKVYLSKCYYNKYMIASTKIINTEIFVFIVALVYKLLSRKALFINRKDNRNC